MHRFFKSKVPAEAEDLTQRTFLACVESRDVIDATRSFPAYLFGIARNRLLTYLRDAKSADGIDMDSVRAVDVADSPEAGSARREERRLVLAAMRRIPLDYQVALELFYWESLAIDEIADVLEAPAGTIKSRLSRGRTLLRDEIVATARTPELSQSTLRYLADWIESLRANLPKASIASPADV